MNSILFICIGNICRSPMAEGLLKHAVPDIPVLSAGISALVDKPADPLAVQIMREQGVDIGAHRARSLSAWMVRDADVILTMDGWQTQFIKMNYPASQYKVFRLCEVDKCDVPDPYRQGRTAFRHACDLISRGVDELVLRLACMEGEARREDLAIAQKKQGIISL